MNLFDALKIVCLKLKIVEKERRIDSKIYGSLFNKYLKLYSFEIVIVIIFTFITYLFFVLYHTWGGWGEQSSANEYFGTVGDSFGVITSLFTVFAFIGVLLTLKEQREQFELQNFESTFFNLLNLHNDILQNMDIDVEFYEYKSFKKEDEKVRFPYSPRFPEIDLSSKQTVPYNETKKIENRDCFYIFYKKFNKFFNEFRNEKLSQIRSGMNISFPDEQQKREIAAYASKQIKDADKIEWIKKAYLELHETHNNNIGHYFRNLYQIFTYIGESNIKDKVKYGKIVRAQFSKYEIFILYYNCFFYKNFKAFAEKYALLKGITEYPEWKNNHIVKVDYYKESAFG